MASRQPSQDEKARKDGSGEVTWKDKIDKAITARRAGKELRQGKKHLLSTNLRTKS